MTAIPLAELTDGPSFLSYEIERLTVAPGIEPPGDDVEARGLLVSRLMDDAYRAMGAGWIESTQVDALREILQRANDDRAAAANAVERVRVFGGLPPAYRQALTLALGVLGDGGDAGSHS